MEKRLLESYKQIFSSKLNTPTWAIHKNTPDFTHELIHCPIPFVGKYYDQQKTKILLYASAENLSTYNSQKLDYLECDDYAINRHRNCFDSSILKSDVYFPNVHIQPINDGCLAIVALYIYQKFQNIDEISPAAFLERIALANYCKYTIQPDLDGANKQNQDYATNKNYLKESHAYLASDIEILNPDFIIIPKTIYWSDCDFIEQIKGNAKIIPIYQINSRNINLRIKKFPKANAADLNKVIWDWYEHLGENGITGKTKENFLSIFNYLDNVLENIGLCNL